MGTVPQFSVIVPTYNRARQLKACLESLEGQTYRGFEILVCDDGSTDNSREVVAAFSAHTDLPVHYFYNENWGGPAHPRNVGIENATAPWICFLDSDDTWRPGKLAACLPFLEHYDFICHEVDIMGRRPPRNVIRTFDFSHNVFEDLMTRGNTIVTSSVCVKRDLLSLQRFPEETELIAVEDFDLWLRLAREGYAFKVIHESLGDYWVGTDNISGANPKQLSRLQAVYQRHLPFLASNKAAWKQSNAVLHYLTGWTRHRIGQRKAAMDDYSIAIRQGRWPVKIKALYHWMRVATRI